MLSFKSQTGRCLAECDLDHRQIQVLLKKGTCPGKGMSTSSYTPLMKKTLDINLLISSNYAANYHTKTRNKILTQQKYVMQVPSMRCQCLLRSYFALCTKLNVDWQGSIIFQLLQLTNIHLLITGHMAVSFSLFLRSCLPSTHLIHKCKSFTFIHSMSSYICCTQMICRLVILPENMGSKQLYSCLWCNFTTTDNLSIWSHSMTIP